MQLPLAVQTDRTEPPKNAVCIVLSREDMVTAIREYVVRRFGFTSKTGLAATMIQFAITGQTLGEVKVYIWASDGNQVDAAAG